MTLHCERSFYRMSTHAHTVCLKAVQAYDTVVHRLQRANRTADEVAVHRATHTCDDKDCRMNLPLCLVIYTPC